MEYLEKIKNTNIEKPKILLVEGQDEVEFFKVLLKKKCLKEDFQIIDIAGRDKFNINSLMALKNIPEFEKVTSLAIIQDADDNDPQSRFDSICSTLKGCNLNPPAQIGSFNTASQPKVGIFILPDGKNEGMLESLCLSTVGSKEKDIMKCVNEFMMCVEKLDNKQPKNKEKACLQAFLSAMPEDTRSIGVAAKKDYWDFDSDQLKPLLDFLKQI